ncbi:MAG: hypothetical protein J6Z34_07250 [Clostridia bacterium]|nr:hypothetical protein [Clostridia bacterium]
MKKSAILIISVLLFFSLAFSVTGFAEEEREVEYSAYSGFVAQVSGTPSYMRIRIEFTDKVTDNASNVDYRGGDKVKGITDAFFVNGYSLDEHAERGNNLSLRIYGGDDANTVELRYYFNSADFKGNMTEGEFAVAVSGLDTGYARLKEGFALVYGADGWNAYKDSSMSALRTVFLSRFNALANTVQGYIYSDENAQALSAMVSGYRAEILGAKSAAAMAGAAVKGMAAMNEFAEVYSIVPIEITKIERAYRYPNKDISFKVFLSENYSDNWYAHVTEDPEYLRSKTGEYGWFYNDEIIDKFIKYSVRESILENLSLNGFTLSEINAMEGENGVEEPVRVDFEIGNAFTGYYCFQVYIDGKSAFAEEYAPDLNALRVFTLKHGARFIDYTVNEFYGFVFDGEAKVWSPADKNAANAYISKLLAIPTENASAEFIRKINEAKAALERLAANASREEYSAAIAQAGRVITAADKTVKLASAGEVSSSAVNKSGKFVYAIEIPFRSGDEKVVCSVLAVRSNGDAILLNGQAGKVTVSVNENGNLAVEIPLSNLSQGENKAVIPAGFALADGMETSSAITIVQTGNSWKVEGPAVKTYSVMVNSPNASVEGKLILQEGESDTYRITAKDGYEIVSVLLDGNDKGAVTEVTVADAREDHTITVVCKKAESASASSEKKKGCKGAMETGAVSLVICIAGLFPFRRKSAR